MLTTRAVNLTQDPGRFIRLTEVKAMTGLSKTSIYRLLSTGTFPKQISIGARTVVWIDKDIYGWMDAQIQHARGGTESIYSEVFISPCPAAKVRRTKQP